MLPAPVTVPQQKQNTARANTLFIAAMLLFSIRGNGEVIRREEFEQRKAAAEAAHQARLNRKPQKLASHGKDLEGCPLLQVYSAIGSN
jgi:hypothetical protein